MKRFGTSRVWLRETTELSSTLNLARRGTLCRSAGGLLTSKRSYAYIHERDAKAVEEKYLKHITPEGEDPWEYNKNLMPEKVIGVKGDAHVNFESFKSYHEILDSFMENMTYPHVTGYKWTTVPPSQLRNKELYHWNDDQKFRFPPVVVLKMQGFGVNRRWVEINWGKRLLRCYTELPDVFGEASSRKARTARREEKEKEWRKMLLDALETDDEDIIKATQDKLAKLSAEERVTYYGHIEMGYRTEYSEIPIPAKWLLELKKHKWPEPVPFPIATQQELPIGYAGSQYRLEATHPESKAEEPELVEEAPIEEGDQPQQTIVPKWFRIHYEDATNSSHTKW